MSSKLPKISAFLAISVVAMAPVAPLAQARSVSAIPAADERDFSNPTTRCNTPSMQALEKKALNQMDTDIKQSHADNTVAAKNYKYKLDLIWDAMLQPYCGYGGYGMTAVTKSFNKSVNRARSAFLAEAKNSPVEPITPDDGSSEGGND